MGRRNTSLHQLWAEQVGTWNRDLVNGMAFKVSADAVSEPGSSSCVSWLHKGLHPYITVHRRSYKMSCADLRNNPNVARKRCYSSSRIKAHLVETSASEQSRASPPHSTPFAQAVQLGFWPPPHPCHLSSIQRVPFMPASAACIVRRFDVRWIPAPRNRLKNSQNLIEREPGKLGKSLSVRPVSYKWANGKCCPQITGFKDVWEWRPPRSVVRGSSVLRSRWARFFHWSFWNLSCLFHTHPTPLLSHLNYGFLSLSIYSPESSPHPRYQPSLPFRCTVTRWSLVPCK